MKQNQIITNPYHSWWVALRIRLSFIMNAYLAYKSPVKVLNALKEIQKKLDQFRDQKKLTKFAKVDDKYYWSYTGPHWPSVIQKAYLLDELNRIVPFTNDKSGLRVLYFAITVHCPLDCEHCLEWDRLNQGDQLELSLMIQRIQEIQELGVAQIQLSGGEPLSRFNDLIILVEAISDKSDIWILTSGYKINKEQILKLKNAGLTGISFSIDHFIEEKHDKFRGKKGVFSDALNGAKLAVEAELVVCFSLCATRDFISRENLIAFADLAKDCGVAFINLIEPKPTGRYSNQDVAISERQQAIMEAFFLNLNHNKSYRHYPIVAYPDFQFRKLGCQGAGNRILYVNSHGEVNDCPFCQSDNGNIKSNSIGEIISNMTAAKCHNFEPAQI